MEAKCCGFSLSDALFYVVCAMNHIKHFQSPQKHFFSVSLPCHSPPLDESTTMGELACATTDENRKKASFHPLVPAYLVSDCQCLKPFFRHIYTHIAWWKMAKVRADCSKFQMPFLNTGKEKNPFLSTIVDSRSRDEKTGNMQNLSSIKQTFLVSW